MSQNYTPEFKKKIVRLHEEEGRTYKIPIRHTLCAELYIFNLLHTVERIELVLLSAFDACSG